MADYRLVEVKDLGGEALETMMDIDGLRLTTFTKPPEVTANLVHNIKNMELRDDDVMLCTAVKSGTHWGFEIISMLLNGKADTVSLHKEYTMLEAMSLSDLEGIPSPRVLNSHLPLSRLPKQLKDKKTKIVLILRNPKDMSVSFYHHHKGVKFYGYNGTFKDYLPLLLNGEVDYGSWFDYVREWENDLCSGDYDIHLLYFEDLKENGVEEINKIARFLGVQDNDELCKAISEKCHFDKMSAAKVYPEEIQNRIFKNNFRMYRKGKIGDWKNYFTVAMNEEFDKLYEEKMKDSKLKFRYSPSNL